MIRRRPLGTADVVKAGMGAHRLKVFFLTLGLVGILAGCAAPEPPGSGTLRPELAFRIGGETGLTAARDLTVDGDGNVYVFDYGDYVIRKFAPGGQLLASFGGTGEEPGTFVHLMTIRAAGDTLLALDEVGVSVFDLDGRLRARHSFAQGALTDLPRIHTDGRWVGERVVEETAEQTLVHRGIDGRLRSRLAAYDLREFYPGVEPGSTFFIHPVQIRTYLYDFRSDGSIAWAESDRLRIRVRGEEGERILFEGEATPLPYPEAETAALRQRQANLAPPLFVSVPEEYQLLHHLFIDGSGDLWVYLLSQERTGLLRLSPEGREKGFYEVVADFDLLSARMTEAGGVLYIMAPSREETSIYTVPLP